MSQHIENHRLWAGLKLAVWAFSSLPGSGRYWRSTHVPLCLLLETWTVQAVTVQNSLCFYSWWEMWADLLLGSQLYFVVLFFFPISLFCGATVLLFSLSCPLVSCAVCFFSQSDPFGVRMLSTAWGMEPWGYPCAEQLLAVVLSWALCLERPMAPCFQRRITTCYF